MHVYIYVHMYMHTYMLLDIYVCVRIVGVAEYL